MPSSQANYSFRRWCKDTIQLIWRSG